MKIENSQSQVMLPFLKKEKYSIASSSILDLLISGRTFEEVKKLRDKAVEIFFEELIDKETLDKVLSEIGWKKLKGKWTTLSHHLA